MKTLLIILSGLAMSLRCRGEMPSFTPSIYTLYPATITSSASSLSAGFTDPFGNQWLTTADWSGFQNNGDITFQFYSPNPNANIGAGQVIVSWTFSGFETFGPAVASVIPVNPPSYPFQAQEPFVSYNQNDVSIGATTLAAYAPYNSLTFQIQFAPEPSTIALTALILGCRALSRRAAFKSSRCV